jgi:hypothetical protein
MNQPRFWTPDRLAKAAAMRGYRALCRGMPPFEQWRIECLVYSFRGHGLPEPEVGLAVGQIVDRLRPWRMSDGELLRAWASLQRPRRSRARRRRRARGC